MMKRSIRNLSAAMRKLRRGAARAFAACQKASVAVETALLLPMVLAFLACLMVLSEGMEVLGKVSLTASTIGNIYAAQTALPMSTITCIDSLPSVLMYPWYNSRNLSGGASELLIDSTGANGVVQWSWSFAGGVVYSRGQTIPLPAGSSAPAGTYVIYTTVNYKFTPVVVVPVGFATLTLSRTVVQPTLYGSI